MILGEFAVNPDVIQDWDDLRVISMNFGFHNGAVISDFPKPWISSLKQRAKAELDGSKEYLKVVERLDRLKNEYLINRVRSYNANDEWSVNALAQHELDPFHKIIDATSVKGIDAFEDIDEDTFEGLRDGGIHRHAGDIAQCSCLLLECSKKIKIIDPFVNLHRGCTKTVKAIINLIDEKNRSESVQLEIHTSAIRGGTEVDVADEKARTEAHYKAMLPAKVILRVIWWRDDATNELHPRYLVSSRGGIRYDRGFIEPNELDEKDSNTDVSMLTQKKANEVWTKYTPEASKYEVVDVLEITGK